MQVTGAKEKININRKVKKCRKIFDDAFENELGLFERILQTSQNTLDSTERLNAIRNLLMQPLLQRSGLNPYLNSQSSSSSQQNNINFTNQSSNNIVNSSLPFYIQSRVRDLQADHEMINNLKEMGFEEHRIRRALIATSNDLPSATEMLLNDTDFDLQDDLPNGFINYSNGSLNRVGSNHFSIQKNEVEDGDEEIYDDYDYFQNELQEGNQHQDHLIDDGQNIFENEEENLNLLQNNPNLP